jgi:hypothetical protein
MSTAAGRASSFRDEKTIRSAHPEMSRETRLMPVGLMGFGSFVTFLLAAVLFWAISILLGIL